MGKVTQEIPTMLNHFRLRVGRRGLAAAVVLLLALFAAAATPQLLGARVAAALGILRGADARWLWLAGLGFALAVTGAACSWRCAIGLCGGRLSVVDSCARYGAGSLVNTLVPARAVVLAALVLAGAISGVVPLWPLLVALALVAAAVGLALAARRSQAHLL